jgi:SAM-dependent methyltransferase
MTAAHFEAVADLYAAARPSYPAAVFDALDLAPGLRVLEIGPGSGQASRTLAARGVALTCYEIGPRLAALTKAAVPDAQVVHAPASTATGTFDLVCGFTSLHWLGGDLWPLAHRLLAPGGRLAVVGTVHVSDEAGDVVMHALQPVYRRYFGGGAVTRPRLADLSPVVADERLFTRTRFVAIPQQIDYDGAGYAQLVATYSPSGTLAEPERAAFLAELATIVDSQGGLRMVTASVVSIFTAR